MTGERRRRNVGDGRVCENAERFTCLSAARAGTPVRVDWFGMGVDMVALADLKADAEHHGCHRFVDAPEML